jgi:hypothetical protein
MKPATSHKKLNQMLQQLQADKDALTDKLQEQEQKLAKLLVNEGVIDLQDEELLIQLIEAYGYTFSDVPRDGNCFFSAIAHQLTIAGFFEDDKYLSVYLRSILKDHIESNYAVYGDFIIQEKNDYLKNLSTSKFWVPDDGVLAMAHELNVNLVIVRSDGQPPVIIQMKEPRATLYIGYIVNKHYMSLVPEPAFEPTRDIAELTSTDVSTLAVVSKYNILLPENQPTVFAELAKLKAAERAIFYSYGGMKDLIFPEYAQKPKHVADETILDIGVGGYASICTIL